MNYEGLFVDEIDDNEQKSKMSEFGLESKKGKDDMREMGKIL